MAMRSWVLKSWPEVHWQVPANSKRWPVFQHMGTDVRPDRDDGKQIVVMNMVENELQVFSFDGGKLTETTRIKVNGGPAAGRVAGVR